MKHTFILSLAFFLMVLNSSEAQNTVGLISFEPDRSFDGYNLFYPHNQPSVFLVNNCGEIVHEWEDDANWRTGNIAYLTEDGRLYKAKRTSNVTSDPIWAGGGGAILEIRDWDNNLIWDFEMNDSLYRLHHDFAVLPNGNIIALAWELKTAEECIAAGRDTSTLAQGELWPDWVFEIDPELDSIIWEWHSWDHLIQDFDSTKANYGVIADHPELIDVNYGRPDGHPDWHHGNALDFSEELNQVMISIPYFDELWIIDHTTTTQEASGSTGGFVGRGGDLIFRWGNPFAYGNGDSEDQRLFFQHDTHWIDDFLEPSHPHYGKIAVFNNQAGPDFSTANVINPSFNMYDLEYDLNADGTFFPKEFDLTITHPEDSTKMYSTGLSSVQFLPNGNTLICVGRFGYAFELTPTNEIVWEYKVPLLNGNPVDQGTELGINNNLTFRIKRYPSDFKAFDNRDLTSKGWIETSPDSSYCSDITSTMDHMDENAFAIYPNPVDNVLTIEWDGMIYANIEIFDLLGHKIDGFKSSGGRKYIDMSNFENGVYFISILANNQRYSRKIIIQH